MKQTKLKITIKTCLWIAFFFYALSVLYICLLSRWNVQHFIQSYESSDAWKAAVSDKLNLMPFRFISDPGHYNTKQIWIINIFGNFILLFPLGIFLPCIFPKTRSWKWKKFIVLIISTILFIELSQYFFICGECDIDDLILNLPGACLGFAFMKLPNIKKLLSYIYD